ncbi:MAG: DUF378 domain-containing protein [Armatimonadota bacterium]|nr:DUF378 domain-containing protein [Armatimonadota bacterium]
MRTLTIISLILIVIGALNWLLVGLFNYDLVAILFGMGSGLSRFIYTLVGLAGVFGIFVLGKLLSSHEDVCVPGHEVGMVTR